MGSFTMMIATILVVYVGYNHLKEKEETRKKKLKYYQHGLAEGSPVDTCQLKVFAVCILGVYEFKKGGQHYDQFWRSNNYARVPTRELLKEELLDTRHQQVLNRCIQCEQFQIGSRYFTVSLNGTSFYHNLAQSQLSRKRTLWRTSNENLEEEEKNKYFVVLRKDGRRGDPAAPDWMVVLRGTRLSIDCFDDMKYNVKVIFETLQTASTVPLLEIVILRLVKIVDADPSKLAVGGHSLGAAIAMLVTRKFALQGIFLNCHFFNPPYAAAVSVVREWCKKFVSPLMDFTDFNWEEFCILFTSLERLATNKVNLVLDGGKKINTEHAEFIKLADWRPNFYLNTSDPLCEPYNQHFFKRPLKNTHPHQDIFRFHAHGTLLRAFLSKAETFHLLPRARIWKASTSILHPVAAHSVDTWLQEGLLIRCEEVNLVTEEERSMMME